MAQYLVTLERIVREQRDVVITADTEDAARVAAVEFGDTDQCRRFHFSGPSKSVAVAARAITTGPVPSHVTAEGKG